MDKIKKLNLKKQLISLKFCYEEQLLQTKALISKVHNLENLFKITKQMIKNKKDKNFDFTNEKRYLLITSQKNNLSHNIDKQSKTLLKSILYNKYQDLQINKESYLQLIEEKKNIFISLKNELYLYKISSPYGCQRSNIFLNGTLDLDSLFLYKDNKKTNIMDNDEIDNSKNKKLKTKLLKKCEETSNQMTLFDMSEEKDADMYTNTLFAYSIYELSKKLKQKLFCIEAIKVRPK